ncbi:MAG: choice-of-anchor D domain-containing protein [Sphingobacteriales bacterium]|nr:MAG: choice-of-anchor D domain-containing protein [Sphingobacteriales bacterium]
MKKIFTLLCLLSSLFSFSQSTTVVISQVYGAGGNTGAVYNADFVELHNVSGTSYDLTGHSVQYASATSTGAWSGKFDLPAVSIPAGGYYLIQMSTIGTGGVALPTVDATSTPSIAMASASGKVALVSNTTALTGCPLTGAGVIDLVGYGTANCSEGTAVGTLSSTNGALRNSNGCDDTDSNSADFTVGAPAPRNSASPASVCSSTPTPAITAGTLADFGNVNVGSASASQTFSVSGSDLTGFPGNITVTAPAGFQVSLDGITWTSSVDIPYTTATLAATQVFVQFVPTAAGAATGDISITGGGIATPELVAVSGTGVIPATPTITAGTLVDFGSVTVGSASSSQTFDVSGSNLTGFPGDVTVTAPAGFQVSLDGVTWSSSVTIPYTSAILASTQIFVQFVPQSAGAASGNISITGGGIAAPVTVAVSGTGVAAGVPNITASTLTAFGNICINTTTATPGSFTLTGTDLTTANVTVGPLAGYTFATTAGGTYTPTLTITQPGGAFSQAVFVQFTPTAVQSYNGNIPVNGGGITTAVNVSANGSGINTTASVVTGNAVSITTSSATLEGTLTANGCSAVTAYGFEYSTTPGFTTGTVAASTNLAGTNFSAGISPLAPSTTYYYKAFATNGGGTVYGVERSFTTPALPPASITATTLADFGSVCVNTTSGPLSFTLTGTDLTNADVTVGPLTGFTFSQTETGTYSNTLTIAQGGGAFTQEVFVKFTPDNGSVFDGNIPVAGGGIATAIQVAATGNGNGTGPQVATTDSLVVNHHTAILSGQLLSTGCGTITEFGIEYSSIPNQPGGQGIKVPGDSITLLNSFKSTVNNLVAGTRYYFKAYATSGGVTSYGDERSFTMLPLPTGLVLYGNPVQRGTTMHFSISNIERGHYSARLYNMLGQVVFQRDLIVQVGFIDDQFVVPSVIPSGVYTFEVINHKFRIGRQVIVK